MVVMQNYDYIFFVITKHMAGHILREYLLFIGNVCDISVIVLQNELSHVMF